MLVLSIIDAADNSDLSSKSRSMIIPFSEGASNDLTLSTNEGVEIAVTALKIVVHFIYGEEFPRRIAAKSITDFYYKVISTLENKIPNSKPSNVQFQCGTKWYKFTEHTDFDSLCLDEDNPELTIQATPIPIKIGVFILCVQV